MTKEEAAQKFVDMLTEQQCRDILMPALIAMYPAVFWEIEKATTPNWTNTQQCKDEQQMQTIVQSIREYHKSRCVDLGKERKNG